MPTITGTIKDSLGNNLTGALRTTLEQSAACGDAIILPVGATPVVAGAVQIAPEPSAALLPPLAYTFAVEDAAGVRRVEAAGVMVTDVMDSIDDIL